MAILYAVGYSAMLAFLVSISDDHQRGLIFGSIASICAISATVTALLGSTITSINYNLLILVLFVTSLVALVLFSKMSRKTVANTA
jgi:MFS family permease